MAEIVGERIAELIVGKGFNQTLIAKLTGMTQPSIGRLISGETRETGKLLELARALGTSPEYLVGETDDPDPSKVGDGRLAWKGPPVDADMVAVAGIDLNFGLGPAFMDQEIVEHHAEKLHFPRAWLRQITTSPSDQLYWTRGVGDSMEPAIGDGDVILIDRSQVGSTFGDLYWALAYGHTGMIKRLRPMPDGSVKILSNNPSVPPEVAYDAAALSGAGG